MYIPTTCWLSIYVPFSGFLFLDKKSGFHIYIPVDCSVAIYLCLPCLFLKLHLCNAAAQEARTSSWHSTHAQSIISKTTWTPNVDKHQQQLRHATNNPTPAPPCEDQNPSWCPTLLKDYPTCDVTIFGKGPMSKYCYKTYVRCHCHPL